MNRMGAFGVLGSLVYRLQVINYLILKVHTGTQNCLFRPMGEICPIIKRPAFDFMYIFK